MANFEINSTHPYWVVMERWVPYHCNTLLSQGQINQQEFNMISRWYPQTRPNFIQAVMQNYPQGVDENMLQSLILNKYIAPMITQMRQNSFSGNSMMSNQMNMFGGQQMGGVWQQQRPAQSMFGGGMTQQSMFSAPSQPQMNFSQPVQQQAQPKTAVKSSSLQTVPKKAWSAPTLEEGMTEKKFAITAGKDIAFKVSNFVKSDGTRITEVFCIDSQIKHLGKDEIINSIKELPGVLADQYFVTCVHYEPKVIHASMKDLLSLAADIGKEFNSENGTLKLGNGVNNITPLEKILDRYPQGLSREFSKMLVDEFNYHVGGGELVDTKHPDDYLGIGKLDDLNVIALGDFEDIDLREIPKEVEHFHEKLLLIIEKSIVTIVHKLKSYIVDPRADANWLDVYNRVIPRFYTNDGINFSSTENLVSLYMMTKEHVGSSQTPRAIKAKEKYDALLDDMLSRFSVVLMPRVTSFTTLDPGEAMSYVGNDTRPKCYLDAVNDMSFFLLRALTYIAKGSSYASKQAPCFLRTINQEAITDLMYGATTDDGLWTGVDPQLCV